MAVQRLWARVGSFAFGEAAFKFCCNATHVGGFWMNDWRPTSEEVKRWGKNQLRMSAQFSYFATRVCLQLLSVAVFSFSPKVSGMQSFHQHTQPRITLVRTYSQ
eukprot:s23_g10.t1